MQTKRIYQVQHWLYGQWIREHNWCKVEAFSKKEAAEKVCGVALTEAGKLAQLRARVLTLGDLKQRSATPFYAVEQGDSGDGEIARFFASSQQRDCAFNIDPPNVVLRHHAEGRPLPRRQQWDGKDDRRESLTPKPGIREQYRHESDVPCVLSASADEMCAP